MPELPDPKIKPDLPAITREMAAIAYAELAVTSNFSFLRGASHPEELVTTAAMLGYRAIALTDLHSLAGVVRARGAAKEAGIPFVVGARLELQDNYFAFSGRPTGDEERDKTQDLSHANVARWATAKLLVYPTDIASYGCLCKLLTQGKRRSEKGSCQLTMQDVIEHQAGLLAIVLPPPILDETFTATLQLLRQLFDDDRLSLAASCLYRDDDRTRLAAVAALAKQCNVPLVAINDVHYHSAARRPLQDVLTCIRLGCTISQAGFNLFPNAERHLKTPEEMARLFRDCPQAIARTVQIAQRAGAFSLDQIKYQYPHEVCPPGTTLMQHLIDLTWQGATERYPAGVPETIKQTIKHEFQLIGELNYPAYFLTVYDIVRWARSRDILCQGRGAAANSAVCYCLGITAVDPARVNLLFERFISKERNEPPDIDIDFEHERREEVIQYIYERFGRHRAAICAEVITYRRRSAVRDVGKALGLSLDLVDRLAKSLEWWEKSVLNPGELRKMGLNPGDVTLQQLAALAHELLGFPRHLSQHVGGFVITEGPLCELVPIENAAMPDRTIIEWDKDDIDAMGMLKIDVLALGMLTAIRKAIALINDWALLHPHTIEQPQRHRGTENAQRALCEFPLQFHTIPPEDPAVYDMLCKADSVGVFQVESRAQMTMLPRLAPRCYYDLVIEVAIVRPGPIQGGMVHPYLRRRNGEEEESYPSEAIRKVLGRTMGVPLFQEQVMSLAIVAAGFTPGEADALRRAMAAWKRKGNLIYTFGEKIIAGMQANGYSEAFGQQVFKQIQGFGEYGFPESHAASFALLVYVSSWIKKYHPAAFCAALINSQPMGFYQPAQLVRDAREHGVEVLPIDVNGSGWDCSLEGANGQEAAYSTLDVGRLTFNVQRRTSNVQCDDSRAPSLRLGLRLVRSLRQSEAENITAAVDAHGRFNSIAALWRASGVRVNTLRALAEADAFNSMGLDRQAALWSIAKLRDDPLPMFDHPTTEPAEEPEALPHISPSRIVVHDYQAIGLSLKAHPLAFVRDRLARLRVIPNEYLKDPLRCPQNKSVIVAGLVLVRQRPGTASGIVFITIEDETASANLIVRPHIFERFRRALGRSVGIVVWGHVERQGLVIHVVVNRAKDMNDLKPWEEELESVSRDFH
jgi:error-prone DNA polymerase